MAGIILKFAEDLLPEAERIVSCLSAQRFRSLTCQPDHASTPVSSGPCLKMTGHGRSHLRQPFAALFFRAGHHYAKHGSVDLLHPTQIKHALLPDGIQRVA
jgi:hypothetical protein